MVENGWTELVEKYERTKKRLALFEATHVEDALARLREPDIDNDGGPGDIAEAVECLLYNNKQFGYDLVELGEKYEKVREALAALAQKVGDVLSALPSVYGVDIANLNGAKRDAEKLLREE